MSVFSCIIAYIYIVTVLRKSLTNIKLTNVNLGCVIYSQSHSMPNNERECSQKKTCLEKLHTQRGLHTIKSSLMFTGISRVTTFRSTTDRIYDGGPIRLIL